MNIIENKNFLSISIYDKNLKLYEILNSIQTKHFSKKRKQRFDNALIYLEKDDYIEHTFLVDKNHKDGKELHCVTHKSGIIFILNEEKFKNNKPCFITIFLARPNQIKRLYEPFNFNVNEETLRKCNFYIKNNLNI